MEKKFILSLSVLFIIFLVPLVKAHCPLCTIGAGAAAAGAVWLGVSKIVVSLFIGAFAMSMGMWFSKIPKKKYFPFQKSAIIVVIFLTTLLPLTPLFSSIGPLYIPFVGEYGLTYAVNYSLVSGLFGGLIVFSTPPLSKKITKLRKGKMIPFQGISITFALLIIVAGIIQILI